MSYYSILALYIAPGGFFSIVFGSSVVSIVQERFDWDKNDIRDSL